MICIKCQILFSGKNKKNISTSRRLKILPSMKASKCKNEVHSQTAVTVQNHCIVGTERRVMQTQLGFYHSSKL